MRYHALALVLLTALAAPALADGYREDTQRGTADFFWSAPLGSERCASLEQLPAALERYRDRDTGMLLDLWLTSAATTYRETSTECEWSVRLGLEAARALIERLAPRCGWSEEAARPPAAYVNRCIGERLGGLVAERVLAEARPPRPAPIVDRIEEPDPEEEEPTP